MASLVAALLTLALLPAVASAEDPRALLVFLPLPEEVADDAPTPRPILDRLEILPGASLGFTGATQGRYSQVQALLDMTQGARTSAAAYDPARAPELEFALEDEGDGALFAGWLDVNARAITAPAPIEPGLLADSVPGGVAYAGVEERDQLEAVAATNSRGRVAAVSLGTADDVADRALALLERHRFVVVGLPTGYPGDAALARLRERRRPGDLLIALQTPPERRAPQLLPTAADGLDRGRPTSPGALTSRTTRLEGVVAGIDLAPTILRHLGLPVPGRMTGRPITLTGSPDAEALRSLESRLRVVGPRRFPALQTLAAIWLVTLLAASLVADQRGKRLALRIGALAFLWMPSLLLLTAALRPARTAELAIVAGGGFLLALLTDRFVRWPRGPLVPCAVAVVAYVADLARGSDLIIRSILGPNPRFGSRYYGIGNELEATLPVLLLIALGILLMGAGRSRRAALIVAGVGAVLGAAIGWGRMGADVGGVITVGAGVAAAVVLLLPGGVTLRRLALAVLAPAVALGALAVLDVVTAGDGHFTRNVLQAEGDGALWDTVSRRYGLAFDQLARGLMPLATAVALLAIAWAVRYRERLYAPLQGDVAWHAALAGGLAAGIAGALFNDSGPVLLLFATATLAITTAYVRGDPRLAEDADRGVARPGSEALAR